MVQVETVRSAALTSSSRFQRALHIVLVIGHRGSMVLSVRSAGLGAWYPKWGMSVGDNDILTSLYTQYQPNIWLVHTVPAKCLDRLTHLCESVSVVALKHVGATVLIKEM